MDALAKLLSQSAAPMRSALESLLDPMGRIERGNIDIYNRPVTRNPDGSISTVHSMSANFGNGEVLIPRVGHDGAMLSGPDAERLYLLSGKHLGRFDNPDNADRYAKALHDQQALFYRNR